MYRNQQRTHSGLHKRKVQFYSYCSKISGRKKYQNFFFFFGYHNYCIKYYQICISFPLSWQAPPWAGSRPSGEERQPLTQHALPDPAHAFMQGCALVRPALCRHGSACQRVSGRLCGMPTLWLHLLVHSLTSPNRAGAEDAFTGVCVGVNVETPMTALGLATCLRMGLSAGKNQRSWCRAGVSGAFRAQGREVRLAHPETNPRRINK